MKRVFKKYGRAYLDESSGAIYPGVTTILDILDKRLDWWKMSMALNHQQAQVEAAHRGERLLDWEQIRKEALKAPDSYRDTKGAQGTRIHKHIEKTLNKDDVTAERRKDPKLTAIMMQIDRWIEDNHLEPILVEAYLVSKEHTYAGAVDLVATQNVPEHGPQLILVDFKTGKSIQDEAKEQLAAYAMAYKEMYGELPDIAFIQHISYDNQIISEASHLHKAEIEKEFQHFLNIYSAFRARWEKELLNDM